MNPNPIHVPIFRFKVHLLSGNNKSSALRNTGRSIFSKKKEINELPCRQRRLSTEGTLTPKESINRSIDYKKIIASAS